MRKVELSWRKVAVCGVGTIAVVVVRIGSEPIGVTLAQIYSPGAGVSAVPVGAESSPASTWDVYEGNRWRVLAGRLSLGPASELPPDGSMATDIRVNEPGPLWVEYTLPAVRDLTAVDTLTFWARTSTSRIGDFVYLVDSGGNRAWYEFSLVGERGWQQFSYWLKSPWGRDANFRFDSVAKVRFAQSRMASGDVIAIGTPRFEWGVMSHCESSAGWYVDIGSAGSSISVSTEAVGGKFSFLAALVTNSWGQADVAMSKATTGGGWDLSKKKTLSFFWKDELSGIDRYLLFYDRSGRYRQWMFGNPLPGHWVEVTVELNKGYYEPLGVVDMSNLQSFEIGVFSLPPNFKVEFMVDEVTVH